VKLHFERCSVLALGTHLPSTELTSEAIETQLGAAYARTNLVPGRLELMTGIRARRHFPVGTRPSEIAASAANDLLSRAPEYRGRIDTLIHASVCRDFLEPATATVVHHRLELSPSCLVFDLSNACLSWLNALVIAAGLIENGQSRAALVVCGEDAGPVVANTIAQLNADPSLTRQSLKPSLATLTLGSGGAAALLVPSSDAAGRGAKLLGGAIRGATEFHELCEGGAQPGTPLTMSTDSETMLREGIALAARTWLETREVLGWRPSSPTRYFTHQVGSAHRKLMVERLELPPDCDFSTFEDLGNMGAASLGVTMTTGLRSQRPVPGEKLALLGIGSGLVCGMLGLEVNGEIYA